MCVYVIFIIFWKKCFKAVAVRGLSAAQWPGGRRLRWDAPTQTNKILWIEDKPWNANYMLWTWVMWRLRSSTTEELYDNSETWTCHFHVFAMWKLAKSCVYASDESFSKCNSNNLMKMRIRFWSRLNKNKFENENRKLCSQSWKLITGCRSWGLICMPIGLPDLHTLGIELLHWVCYMLINILNMSLIPAKVWGCQTQQ